MLLLKIKQCQCAMADGRLDEAFELAKQPSLRAHRHGQELTTKLVEALVERGRRHLAAGRLNQASSDCDKAAYLGGNLADVAQLRAAINTAMRSCENANRQIGQALAAARHHADQGQLTIGQHLLDAVPEQDVRLDGLKQDLAARRALLESCQQKATEALAAGQWEAAIDYLAPLGRNRTPDGTLRQLCGQISEHVSGEVKSAFEEGHLNVAGALLKALDRLPVQCVGTEHLRKSLEQCKMAYQAIESGQAGEADSIMKRLIALWPNAAWLREADEQAAKICDSLSVVRGSPLSLVAMMPDSMNHKTPLVSASPIPSPLPQAQAGGQSFFLHVDGVGSYQVFTSPSISLGPVGASRHVDVPLMLDAHIPPATISRRDEDYFISANQPMLINDRPTASKLLCDGDRIALGARGRIIFRRPSAASTSAVLDLTGTRMAGSTIRQVLLMDREIIMGPGSGAHIRAEDLPAPVVLHRRGQTLVCRTAGQILVDEKPAGSSAEITPGAHISVGSLRFVIAPEHGREQTS